MKLIEVRTAKGVALRGLSGLDALQGVVLGPSVEDALLPLDQPPLSHEQNVSLLDPDPGFIVPGASTASLVPRDESCANHIA